MANTHLTTGHWGLAIATAVLLAASLFATPQDASSRSLVFLTRDGCVNTTTMRARLDQALDRLDIPNNYAVIDADTLPEADARRGYGTPTVLFDSRDLFGMPEPTPPMPTPT
jgi:hypothetical protein